MACSGGNTLNNTENSEKAEMRQEIGQNFYVLGHREGERFLPKGQVMGEGNLATEGTPGWFELSSGTFFRQQTAQAPVSPYVVGFMTSKGFVPSRREIY
jgi:hypothetical protein